MSVLMGAAPMMITTALKNKWTKFELKQLSNKQAHRNEHYIC